MGWAGLGYIFNELGWVGVNGVNPVPNNLGEIDLTLPHLILA